MGTQGLGFGGLSVEGLGVWVFGCRVLGFLSFCFSGYEDPVDWV